MAIGDDNIKDFDNEELEKLCSNLSEKKQECEVNLKHNSFDSISDKIDEIEKDLDLLLDMMQKRL